MLPHGMSISIKRERVAGDRNGSTRGLIFQCRSMKGNTMLSFKYKAFIQRGVQSQVNLEVWWLVVELARKEHEGPI